MASTNFLILKLKKSKSRKAQTTVEFILMATIVAVVVMGVFWPAFIRFIEGVRNDIFGDLKSVLAQDQIGIPIRWFGLEQYSFGTGSNSNGGNSNGNGNGSGDGDNNGDNSSGDDPGAFDANALGGKDGKGGKGGKGAKGGPGSGGGDSSGGDSDNFGGSGKDKGSKGSKRKGGEVLGESGTEGDSFGQTKTKKTTGNTEDESLGGDTSGEEQKEEEAKAQGPKAKKGGSLGGESGNTKRDLLGRKKIKSGEGDCEDIDLFTLVKLGVILAIFILLATVAMSAKGKKGGK